MLIYALFTARKQYRVGTDVLGQKGVKAEQIGKKAREKLLRLIQAEGVLDACMQDNIIPFLGLFGGCVKVGEITGHTKRNIAVCENFLSVEYKIENYKDANLISVLSSKRE
jgi:RNA 3'-terminal phosphate cyclase